MKVELLTISIHLIFDAVSISVKNISNRRFSKNKYFWYNYLPHTWNPTVLFHAFWEDSVKMPWIFSVIPAFLCPLNSLTKEIDYLGMPHSSNKLKLVLLPGILVYWKHLGSPKWAPHRLLPVPMYLGSIWTGLSHTPIFCAPVPWTQFGSMMCVEGNTDPYPSFPFPCMNWPNLGSHNPHHFGDVNSYKYNWNCDPSTTMNLRRAYVWNAFQSAPQPLN